MRANGVFDHRSKVVPVVALRMNPVAKRVRLVPSISRFHDFKNDLIHGEILLWLNGSRFEAKADTRERTSISKLLVTSRGHR